jgi:hypothetical protein
VIRGFEQTDYGDTYAPVPKPVSFRMLIALAARHGWELDQMDVVTAFLNPPVEGDVYMELPEGLREYHAVSSTGSGTILGSGLGSGLIKQGSICKLKKALMD